MDSSSTCEVHVCSHTQGLSQVDILDASVYSPAAGGPTQPKSWKGPWRPHKIAEVVANINAQQYHPAHLTPLGLRSLAFYLGHTGNWYHSTFSFASNYYFYYHS